MTIRANDLALRNLGQDALPAAHGEVWPDVELLITEMVKLEDHRVLLPAVRARMGSEKLQQIARSFKHQLTSADGLLVDIPLAIR